MMYLEPSEIRYSQGDISNHFFKEGRHGGKLIGETLDDICEGRCSIDDIPPISVALHRGNYVTSDNRRLWVFRHLERLGFCTEIPVQLRSFIRPGKLTSVNGGLSVRVRGDPGGVWHRRTAYNTRRPSPNRVIYPSSPGFITSGGREATTSGRRIYTDRIIGELLDSSSYRQETRQARLYIPEEPRRQENDSWCIIL